MYSTNISIVTDIDIDTLIFSLSNIKFVTFNHFHFIYIYFEKSVVEIIVKWEWNHFIKDIGLLTFWNRINPIPTLNIDFCRINKYWFHKFWYLCYVVVTGWLLVVETKVIILTLYLIKFITVSKYDYKESNYTCHESLLWSIY